MANKIQRRVLQEDNSDYLLSAFNSFFGSEHATTKNIGVFRPQKQESVKEPDIFSRKWIEEADSAYSSPLVSVSGEPNMAFVLDNRLMFNYFAGNQGMKLASNYGVSGLTAPNTVFFKNLSDFEDYKRKSPLPAYFEISNKIISLLAQLHEKHGNLVDLLNKYGKTQCLMSVCDLAGESSFGYLPITGLSGLYSSLLAMSASEHHFFNIFASDTNNPRIEQEHILSITNIPSFFYQQEVSYSKVLPAHTDIASSIVESMEQSNENIETLRYLPFSIECYLLKDNAELAVNSAFLDDINLKDSRWMSNLFYKYEHEKYDLANAVRTAREHQDVFLFWFFCSTGIETKYSKLYRNRTSNFFHLPLGQQVKAIHDMQPFIELLSQQALPAKIKSQSNKEIYRD